MKTLSQKLSRKHTQVITLDLDGIRDDNEGAFTLVELLVVILIIAVLVGIAVPAFLGQREAANTAAVHTDLRNAATEFETANISNFGKSITTSAPEEYEIPMDWGMDLMPFIKAGTIGTVTVAQAVTAFMQAPSTPQFHTSDGVKINILTYNPDGSYCLTGEHDDSLYRNGALATFDSEAGGLNTTGGACPASLLTPGAETPVETPISGEVDVVNVGGTGWLTQNGNTRGTPYQASFTVSFTDTDMNENELRAVAESATITGGFTANPATVNVSGNTATTTFNLAGRVLMGGGGTPFDLTYTDNDGSTKTVELWFPTQGFSTTAYQATTLSMWTSSTEFAESAGINHAPFPGAAG